MRKLFLFITAGIFILPLMAGAQATSTATTTTTTPSATSSATRVEVGGGGESLNLSNLSYGIPGSRTEKDPASLIANLYEFALLLGGILAFGSIVYGGIQYLITAGNTSAQHEAKDRIRDALIGLLLLIGIYFVLNIISPDLTKLRFPTLKRLPPPVLTTTNVDWGSLESVACKMNGNSTSTAQTTLACFATMDQCNPNCTGSDRSCVSVKTAECSGGENPSPNCPIKPLSRLSSDALGLEASVGADQSLWAADIPQIDANLAILRAEVTKVRQEVEALGGRVKVTSVYRPIGYQRHLFQIHDRWQQLENDTSVDCAALKESIRIEKAKHGLLGAVAMPTCTAPHVSGKGVDMYLYKKDGSEYNLTTINSWFRNKSINLVWKNIANDPVHFELSNPPFPNACGSIN